MRPPGLTFEADSHTYRMEGRVVPSVTQVLQPVSGLHRVDSQLLARASAFGSAVHKACELDDLDTLNRRALDPALVPYLQAWQAFCRDYQADWSMVEAMVYNRAFHYAGTVDRVGSLVFPGTKARVKAVADLKSSTSLSASVGPQLAAYQKALPPDIVARVGVQLRPDGSYFAKRYISHTDWALFASLLTVRQWCEENGITPYYPQPERQP